MTRYQDLVCNLLNNFPIFPGIRHSAHNAFYSLNIYFQLKRACKSVISLIYVTYRLSRVIGTFFPQPIMERKKVCKHTQLIAFDEGRTLPNLLGYLWSRRCPVHASESWPVFFRSIGRPFIFSAPFWMTSPFRCAEDAGSCIAVCRTFEDVVVRLLNAKLQKLLFQPTNTRTHFFNLWLLLVYTEIQLVRTNWK